MKKFICSLILCAALLCSCSFKKAQYRNDVSISLFSQSILSHIDNPDTMVKYSNEDILFNLGIDTTKCIECEVYVQSNGVSIDEFGVFRAKPENLDYISSCVDSYVQSTIDGKRDWLASYNQKELEKLVSSKTSIIGDYVVYQILDKDVQSAIVSDITAQLSY